MASIQLGAKPLTVEQLWLIAHRQVSVTLSEDCITRVERSAAHADAALASEGVIYGVTTGYGDSCTTVVPADLIAELPLHLSRYHGCGTGRMLTEIETRAVMAVRLTALLHGWSGVSLDLVRLLADMLRLDMLPLIPAEGSVGASGDLTPLSYIAGALVGEREVLWNDEIMMACDAFARAGLRPIVLRPKEALAIMNGTAIMTGLAALALVRARNLARLSSRLTAMATIGLTGNPRHFDERLFDAKPHPGQMQVAADIRADLAAFDAHHMPTRLQDRYSIRCAPHVIGVLVDMLPTFTRQIEIEMNSANDNPLFDPEDGAIHHGGHFYGGHIAFVADGLKILVANLADLMDRQFALLVDTRYNNGLPANLSGVTGPRAAINHGLKAVQIAVSAWTAEALKGTIAASIFSRSTECHNQDKVSMGTIAARDALRVIELTEQVAAAHLLACAQAIRLRERDHDLEADRIGARIGNFMNALGDAVPMLIEDCRLDHVLTKLSRSVASGPLAFGNW